MTQEEIKLLPPNMAWPAEKQEMKFKERILHLSYFEDVNCSFTKSDDTDRRNKGLRRVHKRSHALIIILFE